MKTPYESKPWLIRTYRWLRWRPWYFVLFCYWVLFWAVHLAKLPADRWQWIDKPLFPTRWSFVKHLWTVSVSLAEFKMGNYLTLREWVAERAERQ